MYPALAITMSTTPTTFPSPHPVLTAIDGKPTARTIKQLRKEIYANARSANSDRGGGIHCHLGITMTVATYTVHAGQPFQEPAHPGPQPAHPAAATTAQIGAANRAYDHNLSEFRTYAAVKENIRQQILTAIAPVYYKALEDNTFGYSDVTIVALLNHLSTTYGTITQADLITNRDRLTEPWNPGEVFEKLWERIRSIRATATEGGEAISDGTTIEFTLVALQKAGVYSHAITTWYDKDEDDQTWDLFQAHFTKQDKERLCRLTAQAAGYHGVNKAAAPITPTPVPTTNQIAAAAAAAAAPQVTQYNSNNISLFYCWTHGSSKNPEHTSGSCKSKPKGHSDDATIDDRKGGVTKFNFGRSGKARRVNFQG
jgi:hypothetical protein